MSEQPQQQGTAQTSVDMGPNSYANTLSSSNTDPQIVMESIEERPVAVAEENNRANMDNRIIVGELKVGRQIRFYNLPQLIHQDVRKLRRSET